MFIKSIRNRLQHPLANRGGSIEAGWLGISRYSVAVLISGNHGDAEVVAVLIGSVLHILETPGASTTQSTALRFYHHQSRDAAN